MTVYGPWIEQLEAIAAGRELVAVAGARDVTGGAPTHVHVFPLALLDGKGTAWSLAHPAAVRALAFAGDELLLAGGDDGVLAGWDVTGQQQVLTAAIGAPIRAIAVDAAVARADAGSIAIGTADGALHVLPFAIKNGKPAVSPGKRFALSDGAIHVVGFDPSGLVVAGGADGQLAIVAGTDVRRVSPGGDGGIRALACIGDGRVALGCGDGSVRLCFLVGDVEATDRSGDHGHDAAVRALVLGPQLVDEAGRDSARRMYTAGEDGAVKSWFVDGNRRPATLEPGAGPITALTVQLGPKTETSIGRLWLATSNRIARAVTLAPDATPGDGVAVAGMFARAKEELASAQVAVKVKIATVGALEPLAEDDARELLDLAAAQSHEVAIAAVQAIARSGRRLSRPAVRTALAAAQPELRKAAFDSLLALERDQPLAALRVAVKAAAEDVRGMALDALAPVAKTSVIAVGMVADALTDGAATVRRRAFATLRRISGDLDAIRTTLARGTPDVRAEALLVLGFIVKATDAPARAVALQALDDGDAGVRGAAFLAALAQRPRLAARMNALVPSLKQSFEQVGKQLDRVLGILADEGWQLDDDELEPLFASLACRSADAANRGAGCLLALRDPRAVGAVLQLTREADPALRRGATGNLVLARTIWPDDDRLTARLAWLLDDPDPQVRAVAFDAFAQDLDLAEIALRTSQEDVRVRALQILVKAGAGDARADALLGDALDDEAAKVRSEAFRTLWAWHASEPRVPIERGARSRHADLRQSVVDEIDRRRRASQSTSELDRTLVELVGDPADKVGLAAYTALTRDEDKPAPVEVHLAAMSSPAAAVRAAGAAGAKKAPAASVRARLVQLIIDDNPVVHLAAIEALDAVASNDAEGFALAFGSIFYELRVRAGELCGVRRDARAVAPMQKLLAIPKTDLNRPTDVLRRRAARALADVGDTGAIPFMQALLADEDGIVREMAARGIATAAQAQHDKILVGLLGHADLPVRSWGGEGLAKLGDTRALPVLAGTQRDDHRPLRIGAIVGLVALGPDGVRGLRQGLEDPDRSIQDLAFAVIVARDVALAQAGIAPDLLVDAMSSPSPEIRFAAARLFERRAAGETIDAAQIVGPRQPDKAADMKEWPPANRRAAILQVLADAIASDEPSLRYAAAQVLAVRDQPLTFWREAGRLAGPTRSPAPRTSGSTEARVARRSGWLRRLAGKRDAEETGLEGLARAFLQAGAAVPADQAAAQRLGFGIYAGLVRQAPRPGDADETHRVRRDAVGRLVELARQDAVGPDAVLPVLGHAVGDPHHLVRQAALAALRSLYPTGALAPLQLAIAGAADLGKAAIDELVELAQGGDDRAAALVRGALDADDAAVRAHAALRLPRLYPAGSTEPQLVAARSRHSDIRLAAIAQLAAEGDQTPAIRDALVAALASEHPDLRLRAAVALARRGEPTGIEVLGAFLRSDDHAEEALDALVSLGSSAAADAIAARLDDDPDHTADRHALIAALAKIGDAAGAASLVRLVADVAAGQEGEAGAIAVPVLDALAEILRDRGVKAQQLPDGSTRARYRESVALAHLARAMTSPLPVVRQRVATLLGDVDDRAAEDLLAKLLADRDPTVRVAAADALALRAEHVPTATLSALEAALRGGRRELVIGAAVGLAARKRPEAFQPLLLVAKAGEPAEQARAVVWLGALGDHRALDHLVPLFEPGPEASDAERALQPAAAEALGRMLPALEARGQGDAAAADVAADMRGRVERLALAGSGPARARALTGLRHAGDPRSLAILEQVAADREARTDVRAHAIEQLGLAPPTPRPEVEAGTLRPTAGREPLLAELLSDDDSQVRTAALAALGRVLGGDRTRIALHALGSPHDEVSAPAARYLATAGDPATLVGRLGTIKSGEIRRMLREGLVRRNALPVAELDAALRGADAGPRTEAAWIAGAGGDAARPLVAAVATAVSRGETQWRAARGTAASAARAADEAEAWRAALWAAQRVGLITRDEGRAVRTSAMGLLSETQAARIPDPVRRAATHLLADGDDAAPLLAMIGDGDREVRAVASRTLATRKVAAVAAVRAVGSRADATTIAPLALTAWGELAPGLVADAGTRAWALAVALEGKTVGQLIAIARAKGKDVHRLAAIAALGRLGGEEAKAALEAIHGDDGEDDAVKLAAWKALKRLLRQESKKPREGDKPGKGESRGGHGGDDDEGGEGDEETGDTDEAGEDEDDDGGDDGDDEGGDSDDDGDDDGADEVSDDDEDGDDDGEGDDDE